MGGREVVFFLKDPIDGVKRKGATPLDVIGPSVEWDNPRKAQMKLRRCAEPGARAAERKLMKFNGVWIVIFESCSSFHLAV